MVKKQQPRSQAKKAAGSRPQAASQPGTSSTSQLPPLTAFSPSNRQFALVTQAVDRQRLTIYESSEASTSASGSSRLLVDHIVTPASRCTALVWASVSSATRQQKKPRASNSGASDAVASTSSSTTRPAVALAFESGQIQLIDPALGKVVRVLADPAASSTSAAITSLSVASSSKTPTLYATSKDGLVRVWSLATAGEEGSPAPPTARISPSPAPSVPNALVSASPSAAHILLASHTISQLDGGKSSNKVVLQYAAHASPLTHLTWINGSDFFFVSAASKDPVLYIWKVGKRSPVATIELEQGEDVLRIHSESDVVALVGSQGYVGLYDVASVTKSTASQASGTKLLQPTASVHSAAPAAAVDVKLDPQAERLSIARLVKGLKLDIASLSIRDVADSKLLTTLALPKATNANLLASGDDEAMAKGVADLQRYSDPSSASGRQSGVASGTVVDENGDLVRDSAVELADSAALNQETGGVEDERSLEDRLRGMKMMRNAGSKSQQNLAASGQEEVHQGLSDDDRSEDDEDDESADSRPLNAPTTSLSLATSLSQALHSSDSAMLSSLLTSANPQLIKSTVLRISGPNAVKLLEACVERLHRGGSHVKSRGAVGSNKARGLVEWIKWVLRLHAGYLMSVPGLTGRLAGLHGSLTHRLASHQRLLALQGRLELVLAQIELRGSYDVVSAGVQGVSSSAKGASIASSKAGKGVAAGGNVWKEDEDDDADDDDTEDEDEEGKMSVDEDEDEDEDDDDDDDEDVEAAEEEGDVDDIGLDSHINGVAGDDDSDEDDEDAPPTKSSRARRALAVADTSMASGAATSDESDDEEEDEEEEGSEEESEDDDDEDEDEDDDDLDEDDESDLEDDEEDSEDEEDDEDEDEDEEGGGLLDLEAQEGSDEDDEDESEEE